MIGPEVDSGPIACYVWCVKEDAMHKRPSYTEVRDALDIMVSLVQLMQINAVSPEAIAERKAKAECVLRAARPQRRQ